MKETNMRAKKFLVGTSIGRALVEASQWISLRTVSFSNPEKAHCLANDIIAGKLISRICPADGTFLDVGAHIGSILSDVHYHSPNATIIAFEPDPSKIAHLRSRYAFCELFDVALGEGEGTAELQIDRSAPGLNSLVIDATRDQSLISVRIASLDTLLGNRSVDVMKIDVEGAELGVLIGGEKLIQTHKPTIMFESTSVDVNALGYSAQLLWLWLTDHGYQIFTPDKLAHDAHPLKLDAFLDGHQYPFHTFNYFAVFEERRNDIRDIARQILNIRVSTS